MVIEKVVLTVDESAVYLGISRPHAFKSVHDGSIPSIRIGRRILVPLAALNKLLEDAGNQQPKPES